MILTHFGFTLLFSLFLLSDDSDRFTTLQRDIEILKQGQANIEKSLGGIKDLLMGKRPPLENVIINIAWNPTLGDDSAKVAIVEFTDFQCPFCADYHRRTFVQLNEEYVKTGKVQYISRNFPLPAHMLAEKAAEAVLCAGDQGKYWEARDRLFANQQALDLANMSTHAEALNLNVSLFDECLKAGKHASTVQNDLADAKILNIQGTPSFFIGYAEVGDPSRIHAVRLLTGDLPFREFQNAINELLSQLSEDGKHKCRE